MNHLTLKENNTRRESDGEVSQLAKWRRWACWEKRHPVSVPPLLPAILHSISLIPATPRKKKKRCQTLASWSSSAANHTDLSYYLVRNDLDADRICGYGTSRCRRYCKRQEIRIGRCPNTYPCCLKKWRDSSLNPMKDKNPEEPGP